MPKGRGRPPNVSPNDAPPIPGWSARLRERRELLGVSQTALGERIGRSQTQIASYEKGNSEPGLFLFDRLANEFSVSPQWLIFGDDGNDNPLLAGEKDGQGDGRIFAWALHRVAKMLVEESFDDGLSYLTGLTAKVLPVPTERMDEAAARKAVTANIEYQRKRIRSQLDKIRKDSL